MSKSITIQFPIKDKSPLLKAFNRKFNRRKVMLEKLSTPAALRYVESRLGNRIDHYSEFRSSVRRVRESMRSTGTDKLMDKLVRYGNEGRWGYATRQKLAQVIYESKRPDASDFGEWVSVEIECVFKTEQSEQTFVSQIRSNGCSKYVTVKSDSSIRALPSDGEGAYGREIIVSFKKKEPQVLMTVCQALNSVSATVNKSCGLHVHFDMRHVTHGKTLGTAARRIAQVVPALKQMLPASRRDNQYCSRTINSLKDGSRYSFVNMQSFTKHKTLEIRGHSGTIDGNKIFNWISLLDLIMKTPNQKEVNTIPELLAAFRLPANLSNYVMHRYIKFNPSAATPIATGTDDVAEDHRTA